MLNKKLKIIIGKGTPFEQEDNVSDSHGKVGIRRLYRAGVRNVGGATISRVEVELEKIEPLTGIRTPTPLRIMHDRPVNDEWNRVFSLDRDQIKYIDVVMQDEWPGSPPHTFVIPHTVSGTTNGMNPGRFELTIFAHGDDAEPDRAVFVVDLDDNNRLRFQPKESRHNQS